MTTPEQADEIIGSVPIRVRWLAIAAGCFSGLAGSLLFGPLFLIFPSAQILGAVIAPHSPRVGKVLMAIGACILTFYAVFFLGRQALGGISVLRVNSDLTHIGLFVLLLISLVLVIWCDIALVMFANRAKKTVQMG
jgi:glucan phosphoethanolaminetransferase (alkaline phosphatase superfamily)